MHCDGHVRASVSQRFMVSVRLCQTYCKKRMFGRPLIDVLCEEFTTYSREYYVRSAGFCCSVLYALRHSSSLLACASFQMGALSDGRVQLSDKKVPPETRIVNGDFILHFVHRHEPPVLGTPILISEDTSDTVRCCARGDLLPSTSHHCTHRNSWLCRSPRQCQFTLAAAIVSTPWYVLGWSRLIAAVKRR